VIGTYNSGCAAVEIPILNGAPEGALAMVSPANTYVGLTRAGPGSLPGEPETLYPRGVRNYVRVVAADDVQGPANAVLAKRLGITKLFLLHSGNPQYGRALGESIRAVATRLGIAIAGFEPWDPSARGYTALARKIERSRADAVFLGGIIDENGPALVRGLSAVLGSGVHILAPDGFTPFPFLIREAGTAAEGMTVSLPGPAPSHLPEAGRRFVAEFENAVAGRVADYTAPAAQATEVLLDAIARSDGTRASVVEELFRTRVKDGILGSFSFDRNGDTTAGAVTIFRVEKGNAKVFTVITPPANLLG
jgi:branched-chain amino acid transport system substrate-binding protein